MIYDPEPKPNGDNGDDESTSDGSSTPDDSVPEPED